MGEGDLQDRLECRLFPWRSPGREAAGHGLQELALGLPLGLPLLLGAPALAGSITVDSIFDKQAAQQEALSDMPRGASVTRSECQEISVGLDNSRYRCTVWYVKPTPQTGPQPTPSAR